MDSGKIIQVVITIVIVAAVTFWLSRKINTLNSTIVEQRKAIQDMNQRQDTMRSYLTLHDNLLRNKSLPQPENHKHLPTQEEELISTPQHLAQSTLLPQQPVSVRQQIISTVTELENNEEDFDKEDLDKILCNQISELKETTT